MSGGLDALSVAHTLVELRLLNNNFTGTVPVSILGNLQVSIAECSCKQAGSWQAAADRRAVQVLLVNSNR